MSPVLRPTAISWLTRRVTSPGGYFVTAIVLSALVAVGAMLFAPLLLGVALATLLVLVGLVLIKHRSMTLAFPGWCDVMPCYLSIQDQDLRIIKTNDRFRHDFGARVGEYCYRVYKHRDSPCPQCPVLRTFATGANHTSEEVVVTKDGTVANVVVTSTPLRDRRGGIVAVVEMSTNVTELKSLNQELTRSKQDFRSLFDIVPCYVSIQDRDYCIIETNALFRQDFGEHTRDRCYRAYKGRASICPDCPVEKTFADGKSHTSEEVVTTKDGRRANMIVCTMPVHDERGEITGVMEVSTNITEVKRLQSLATVGIAVTGMAHRIKNVLMGLKGGVFVVNNGFETNDQAGVTEGWRMVERNVDKVARLAKDLLFCSKDHEPNLEDNVSPEEVVRDVYDLFRLRAEADNIEIRVEVSDKPHYGRFDRESLRNLVTNLAANALDACRFDPHPMGKRHNICLRCCQDPAGNTVVEVSDNGAGIPQELQQKVFDGFFSTKGTEGTGLGLLVVQKVAEEHRGTVALRSKEGEGTTFTVCLPGRVAVEDRVAGVTEGAAVAEGAGRS